MDVFIQFSEGDPGSPVYVNDPTILGQTKPIEVLPLPEHSALIYIYQDPATNETAFHPVQADQHCHRYGILNEANLRLFRKYPNNSFYIDKLFFTLTIRNGHGAINCNTFSAKFFPTSATAYSYGGTNGKGSYGCPSGFVGVGYLCFIFPIQNPALQSEMVDRCKDLDAIPYAPLNLVQNIVVKGLAKNTV